MKANRGRSIERMAELGRVSRSGFYRFQKPEPQPNRDMELRDAMHKVAVEWPAYGRPRMTRELQRRGWEVGETRVRRLMREDNLLCVRKRKFILTTDSSDAPLSRAPEEFADSSVEEADSGNPRYDRVIVALLQEKAAASLGISTVTLWRLMQKPDFAAAFRKARRDAVSVSVARLKQATGAAVATLLRVMADRGPQPRAGSELLM